MTVRIALLCLLLASAAALADGVAWSSLNPEQQKMLGAFEEGWSVLPAERQRRLALGAERFINMSAQERQAAK